MQPAMFISWTDSNKKKLNTRKGGKAMKTDSNLMPPNLVKLPNWGSKGVSACGEYSINVIL